VQLFGVAAKHPPLKLELAFNFNAGDDHGQHLFMNAASPRRAGGAGCN
jgi:hypothetical protein